MGFVASCIDDVADTLGVDYSEVYQRMNAVKMIGEYIIPNYEVLHSESRKNVTEGLIDTLKRWEGSEIAVIEISDDHRTMSEDQHRKIRNIIRWQRIGCIVVKISETLNVSLKERKLLIFSIRARLAEDFTMRKQDSIFKVIYMSRMIS